MDKSTISMAIFNSYVSLPEGKEPPFWGGAFHTEYTKAKRGPMARVVRVLATKSDRRAWLDWWGIFSDQLPWIPGYFQGISQLVVLFMLKIVQVSG